MKKWIKRLKRDIKLWLAIEVKPPLTAYLEKKSLTIKQWMYIHDIPSIKEIIEEFKDNQELNATKNTYDYYDGIIRAVPPIEWSKNKPVQTKDGVGRIKAVIRDPFLHDHITKVIVEIMTINFSRSRGYIKYFNASELTQLVVYHKLSNQFILLSPKDYVYFVDENENITYRVTKRKYATLSPDYKVQTEHVRLFNEYKGGSDLLRRLHQKGYVIVKQ